MPEKGWSVLTVRASTATKIKGLAKERGLTVDEAIDHIFAAPNGPRPSPTGQWSVCETRGSKVRTRNLQEHAARVHSGELTVNRRA